MVHGSESWGACPPGRRVFQAFPPRYCSAHPRAGGRRLRPTARSGFSATPTIATTRCCITPARVSPDRRALNARIDDPTTTGTRKRLSSSPRSRPRSGQRVYKEAAIRVASNSRNIALQRSCDVLGAGQGREVHTVSEVALGRSKRPVRCSRAAVRMRLPARQSPPLATLSRHLSRRQADPSHHHYDHDVHLWVSEKGVRKVGRPVRLTMFLAFRTPTLPTWRGDSSDAAPSPDVRPQPTMRRPQPRRSPQQRRAPASKRLAGPTNAEKSRERVRNHRPGSAEPASV